MKKTNFKILLCSFLILTATIFISSCAERDEATDKFLSSETKHEHIWSEWSTVKEPSCTQKGAKERVCECGKKETEAIDIKHSYTESVTPPAKTTDGYTAYTCSLCGFSYTSPIPATGSVGLKYKVNDNKFSCTVTGIGTCEDKELYIPTLIDGYKVIAIGESAFSECNNLTSVFIPKSVTTIGSYAFSHCVNITSVNIPDSVTSIGTNAFYYCSNLISITIPDSVTTLGDHAFLFCTKLSSVSIGRSIKSIGFETFGYCRQLTSVTIPNSVTSIDNCAFYNCWNLKSIVIPVSVTSIGECALSGCDNLTSIYYSGKVNKWNDISIAPDNNSTLTNATRYYYSEVQPTDVTYKYWRYVDGVPIPW